MGVRSAAIVSGHSRIHERLERELAALKHAEACLLFPSGFVANLAAITALASDEQVAIFSDELNHASLIDGCRLARTRGASVHVYKHCDYAHLSDLLQHKGVGKRKLVVTDGVFSMDGDCADVQVCFSQLALISRLKLCHSYCIGRCRRILKKSVNFPVCTSMPPSRLLCEVYLVVPQHVGSVLKQHLLLL